MSRIPPVRQWRVRYYMGHTLLADFIVETINKRFARWLARDRLMAEHVDRLLAADRVTISPMNKDVRP
jgi:hypothetical protein